MTERERWIVYPLLFLALGAALRDKLVDRTTTKSIVCQELSIVDEESADHQPPRTLAKIGVKPKSGDKSAAYLQINGELVLVDEGPLDNSPPRVMVKMGRTDAPLGVPASGYAYVNGQVTIDGLLNARQYVFWQPVPGVPMPGVLQVMPQAGPRPQNPSAPNTKSPGQSSASGPKKDGSAAPPSSPAGDQPAEK
jgi:hypothetical protein